MKKYVKSDLGTDERVVGEIYRDEPTGLTAGSKLRRRIMSQSLIDRYYQRGLINSRQYNTAQYLSVIHSKGAKPSSMKFDARVDGTRVARDNDNVGFSDYIKAMRKLTPQMFRVVQWIVFEGSTATSLDAKEYNNRRVSMNNLRAALDFLSNHFGIS
jgi:hypothetical protein